jgi:hypothetical protein
MIKPQMYDAHNNQEISGYMASIKDYKLIIHADGGARSGFVAAWLHDNLTHAGFHVGDTAKTSFLKIHIPDNNETIKNLPGTKIRIKTTFDLLNLQLLLFLRKNVHTKYADFTRDEYSLESFSKVYVYAKQFLELEKQVDYSLYDHIILFDDTFNMDKLIDLYYQYNNRYPKDDHINLAMQHNTMNQISIDTNHACNIAAMILETESKLGLLEENRCWSLPVLYNTTKKENLYETIKSMIVLTNYRNMPS